MHSAIVLQRLIKHCRALERKVDMLEHCLKKISIITPIYNESKNIDLLINRLFSSLNQMDFDFEIIAVDDGSEDDSFSLLCASAKGRPELKVLKLSRNYGQTAAMMAGFDYATGDYIVVIDADLQNSPEDIPRLIEKLEEGFDVVSGWRKDRKDAAIRRNFVSRVANRLISRVTGVKLHDYGCSLKAYRAHIISGLKLYGEMHRFIPIYATLLGGKVTEIPVSHHARVHGDSKYGLERTLKVVFDLLVVKFLAKYFTKPMYLFGSFGLFSVIISLLSFSWMLYLKIFQDVSMIQTPLPVLSAIAFLMGIMSILMGLIAEMQLRTYYESQRLSPYRVSESVNFPKDSS